MSDGKLRALIEELRAPWTHYDGKREILCCRAADELERLTAAASLLSASSNEGWRVKPLEWSAVHNGDMHLADTLLGEYRAWEIDKGYWWHVGMHGGRPVKGGIEAAKAAAQADYEARIRSAILPESPSPEKEGR